MTNIRANRGQPSACCGTTAGRLWVVLAFVVVLMFPAIAVFASDGPSAMVASGCHEQVVACQIGTAPDLPSSLSCHHTDMACGAAGCIAVDFPSVIADVLPAAPFSVRLRAAMTALHIGRATAPIHRPPITAIPA